MIDEKYTARQGSDGELIINRWLNAPKDLVYKVFTEEAHLGKWWSPKGFTNTYNKIDFKVGGYYHYCNNAPDGTEFWGKFIYKEIKHFEKVVFTSSFSNKEGEITIHPLAPTWPKEILNTFFFEEVDGKTKLTIIGLPINASEEEFNTFKSGFSSMKVGFNGTLENLENYLTSLT